MWHKAVSMGHSMRIRLTRGGLQTITPSEVLLFNKYNRHILSLADKEDYE